MKQAFIICQIGNAEIDLICSRAIVPALEATGFNPKRVDKHNQGGLLKSEIIQLIRGADIIVADLTNARPNVYLEIGFTMGTGKFSNLILTVRQDHFPNNPGFRSDGPRVHFDLIGYDILGWHPDNLDEFRVQLTKRINRRITVLASQSPVPEHPLLEIDWLTNHRKKALNGLASAGLSGFMQVQVAVFRPKGNWDQVTLRNAVRDSNIHTFGWPVVPFVDSPEFQPRSMNDGLVAEIVNQESRSYDYWALLKTGDLFFLSSFFEDEHTEGQIFFNTQIVRVTETLLFLRQMYSVLKLDPVHLFEVTFSYGGLRNRSLTSTGRIRSPNPPRSEEDTCESSIITNIGDIKPHLTTKVIDLLAPLFRLFDFKEYSRDIYSQIVIDFVNGKLT